MRRKKREAMTETSDYKWKNENIKGKKSGIKDVGRGNRVTPR